MTSLHKNNNNNSSSSSSPTIRFLGFLTQPEDNSDSNSFELEESDVIWSSSPHDSDSPPPSNIDSPPPDSISSPPLSISPATQSHSNSYFTSFRSDKFGLSAALDHHLHLHDHDPILVHRKASFSPSFSTAARMIAPPRSDDFKLLHQSAPVNAPIWPNTHSHSANHKSYINNNYNHKGQEEQDDDDDQTEDEMLPPHEIVARSHSTTFSVFEGVGRTLKGRDLRRVRNAVWQKTEAPVNFLTDPREGRFTLRPADILVYTWSEGMHACVDITGASPMVGFGNGDFEVGRAARSAAIAKEEKHSSACKANQHSFIPFVFDIFGFLASEAVELLRRVQKVMDNNVMTVGSNKYVFWRIGFAIQKGLAAQFVARLSSTFV